MKVKIAIILLACLLPVDGCNKSSNSNCSGSSSCIHHISKRSPGEDAAFENDQKKIEQLAESHYSVKFFDRPCDFSTYDIDHDGIISQQELFEILGFERETEAMFKDLDAIKGDGTITSEEFDAKVTQILSECTHSIE